MDMSLTKPVSAEQPCGPDPEYDPEYLLLFSRAAPQAEAQYGDFVSTPEAVNWPEIERDARRLLTRSKDIRGVDPAAAQSHPAGWRTGTGGNAHTTGRTERNLV